MMIEYDARDIKFALDIGTRSVIGAIGVVKNTKLNIIKESYIEHEERAMIDGQIHDIGLVTKTVKSVINELQEDTNIKLENVTIAAAGRFLQTVISRAEIDINNDEVITGDWIKTLELKAIKEAEEKIVKQDEGSLYCVGYSVKNYYLNDYVISNLSGHKGEKISVEIIATFLPKSVVDSLYSVMDKCGLKVNSLTLEPIAAIEAVVPQRLRLLNIALVDIGAGTSDIAISADQSITAYGMVPVAGDEVTEAIAKECLVDFNTAEVIKKQINEKEEIKYNDILGFENVITSESLKAKIAPIVEKIGKTIGEKIIELNGDKSPSAIFVVGGGAHTPGILDEIAKNAEIPIQRIGIKDREAIEDFIGENNFGSAGVTVIGIGLVGVKNEGNDFVNVYLNHVPISLFNSHKHSVGEVLVHADIDPTMLMAKRGKNLRYTLNGVKKISFGAKGTNAEIRINGEEASVDSKVEDGNEISIVYAKEGLDGKATVIELVHDYESIDVKVNDKVIYIDPISFINGVEVDIKTEVRDGDNIEIIYPKTIGDLRKYILKTDEDILLNELKASDDYVIKNGDTIIYNESPNIIDINEEIYEELIEKEVIIDKECFEDLLVEDTDKITETTKEIEMPIENDENSIIVTVNGDIIRIPDMKTTMFVQIFTYIDFDLSTPQGTIVLELNGQNAAYTDIIKTGDIINIYWK